MLLRCTVLRRFCAKTSSRPDTVACQFMGNHGLVYTAHRAYHTSPMWMDKSAGPPSSTRATQENGSHATINYAEDSKEGRSSPPPPRSQQDEQAQGSSAKEFVLNPAPWINQRRHGPMSNVEKSSTLQRFADLCGPPLVFLFTVWAVWWWWAYMKWWKPAENDHE